MYVKATPNKSSVYNTPCIFNVRESSNELKREFWEKDFNYLYGHRQQDCDGETVEDEVKLNQKQKNINYINKINKIDVFPLNEDACGCLQKDLNKASRWFRKAEKKIKSVMIIDIDNKDLYKKNLDIIRYKRDVAEGIN